MRSVAFLALHQVTTVITFTVQKRFTNINRISSERKTEIKEKDEKTKTHINIYDGHLI